MVGELPRETEHFTAPDSTNFLCVLQILLYCLLKFLDGGSKAGAIRAHPLLVLAVFGVVGRSSAGTVGLWVLGQEFPLRSSLDPTLLLTPPRSSSPKLSW